VNGDQVGTIASPINPHLDVLGNYGGPTQTHRLQANSTAIDGGDNCVFDNSCSPAVGVALTTDQRGAGFPRKLDGDLNGIPTVDIGSYELNVTQTGPAFFVNTTADPGDGACDATECTLREAINAANANADANTINFAIPVGFISGGVFTIQPTSELPQITRPVTINGATQTTFTGNTNVNGPEVVVNGSLAGVSANGFFITGSNNIIENLVINGFGVSGIVITYDPSATSNNQILSNYIGTNAAGSAAVPNGTRGVDIHVSSNDTVQNNVISGNAGEGLSLCDASNNSILNNYIGTDRTGVSDVHNGSNGIHFQCSGASNNTIQGNTVAFNLGDGFQDDPDYRFADNHHQNHVTQNSMFSNTGLGINLLAPPYHLIVDGVTPNDTGDGDTGANLLQNFPVITFAQQTGTTRKINGTLNSTPGQAFTIEFFANTACDGSGNGEGKTYLGNITTGVTDGAGNVLFTFNSPGPFSAGDFITATATDPSNNTSEFSACFTATAGTAGFLEFASATYSVAENAGPAQITIKRTGGSDGSISATFNTSDGTATVADSDYNAVNNFTVTFADGETAPRTVDITINNDSTYEANETVNLSLTTTTVNRAHRLDEVQTQSQVGQLSAVLTITNDDNPPATLVVNTTDDQDFGFCLPSPGHCSLREAINAANSNADANTINFNIPASDAQHYYYKDDGTGTSNGHVTPANVTATTASDDTTISDIDPDWPHSWWSINPGSALPLISSQVTIDGYSQPGASMNTQDATDDAIIRIELNGTGAGANVHGLTVNALSFIQGLAINRFTGNGIGLLAGSDGSGVAGNFIGTDVSGTLAAANGDAGVFMTNTSNVLVGCTFASERNVISGNTAEGVEIFNATNNFVQGNFIGVAADGTTPLGNGGAGIEIYSSSWNNTIGVIPVSPNNRASRAAGGSGFGCRASQSASATKDREGRPSVQVTPLSGANVIAGNGGDGVRVTNFGDINNLISQNSIYSNSGLGINLGTDSVTANDDGDSDDGPNHLQNFPVITVASASGSTGTISGTFDSGGPSPAYGTAPFTIEFFKNSSCNAVAPNDYGEGQVYAGSLTMMGGGGFTSGTLNISAGDIVTATATDANGNTSEFGQCFPVSGASPTPTPTPTPEPTPTPTPEPTPTPTPEPTPTPTPSADLSISKTDSEDPITEGNNLTYTITATNNGPDTASNVVVSDPLPAGVTFVSASAGCSESAGTVTCNQASLANSANAIFTITVTPQHSVAGTTISNTATVTATEDDPTTPNSATETTQVNTATCTPPPAGMVAWYPGDGNADDIQGPTFENGGLQGGATFAPGKVGQAFSLDGVDDLVVVPSTTALEPTAITLDAWIFVDATADPSGTYGIVAKYLGVGGERGYQFFISNRKLVLNAGTSPQTAATSTNDVLFGQWNHVAFTIDASASQLYLNGNPDGPPGPGVPTIEATSQPFRIGVVSADFFKGRIDEVEVFGRTLSASDIQAIYDASFAGKCRTCTTAPPDMVSWYAAENNANDRQGPNNGTLVGGATFAPGKVGQGFNFDGSGFVTVPDSPSLQLPDAPFSIDLWFKTNTTATSQIILSKGVSDANEEYSISLDDGGIYWDYGGAQAFVKAETAGVVAGRWYHLTVLYDPALNPRGKIYLNGVEQTITSSNAGAHIASSGSALYLGSQNAGSPYYPGRVSFNGLIDEVELFNRALTQPQIAALADAGNAGKCHTSTVQFAQANTDDTETNASSHVVNIAVTRAGAHDSAADVTYTVTDGTATTADSDYSISPATNTLHWNAGDSSPKNIAVTVNGDTKFETNETVNLALSSPVGATLGTPNAATLTILNDDNAPSFTIDDVTHNEGNASTTSYTFTVTKTGSTALSSSVNFTTQDGSATLADSDYQTNSGMLTFGSAVTTMQITVLVNGDTNFEPNETFKVHLSGAINATIASADGTGTITNDDGPSISGHLNYRDSVLPVPNVTMTLTGNNGFVTRMTTTDSNGDYTFTNVPVGNDYAITPSKTGDVNGLESFDASQVARYVAGLDTPTANQGIAADADNDGGPTSFDAALIARYVAGLSGTGIVGTWKFVPTTRSYPALGANQSAQNFTAILVGETSGNWTPPVGPVQYPAGTSPTFTVNGIAQTVGASPSSVVQVTVALPHVPAAPGSTISVPVTVSDLTGLGVKAYDLQVTFDSTIVQPAVTPFVTAGTISSGMLITPNATNADHLIISAFQATDLTGAGTLINLRFTVVGTTGQVSPLTFQNYTDPGTIFHPGFRFNAGTPTSSTTNGSITVSGPTASVGTVDGHITDTNGRPISGAVVLLSGPQNRETITDASGNYSFANVETNGFYTVTPSRANYTFSPPNRSFSSLGAHTEASFTGSANGDHTNAIDTTEFFVRQQYLDFLGREPDPPGFTGWVNTIANCAPGDSSCDRVHVSEMFFRSQEFQERGYFVYRFYSSAFGRKPDYGEFTPDLARVSGFLTNDQLEAAKTAFIDDFMARPGFAGQYSSLNNTAFVDALINTAAVNLANRQALLDGLNAGTLTRAQVLRQIAESGEVYQKYYNQAFVVMEYFGYLRRDPDALYLNWIQVLDANPADSRHMVDGFVNSTEYRNRFAQ
jgi:uncharacterized repeat protein (TIGR01451 family)/CSLREA domain-containing protein